MDPERQSIRAELLEIFGRGADAPLAPAEFDRLALRIFAHQFQHNAAYGAYCRRRGATPDRVRDATAIPPVPAAAFKEVPLVAGPAGAAEAVFRTSGTTGGRERRGEHHVLDLSLYHASLVPTFRSFLLPDDARLPMLSLLPPPAELPDSSLAHMIGVVVERLGDEGSGCFASVDGGLDHATLGRALRRAETNGRPVCLLGTSLSFLHWLERLEEAGERFRLPPGSRLMDTGGFKGASRQADEAELREAYADRLGLQPAACVNEYGMTELTSQYYDTSLRDGSAVSPRVKAGPGWLRARVVDPETLAPLPPGEPGLLQHVDLANLDSVLAVQTEDLGREVDGGFVLLGRASGAPARGCSIAMDELLGG